MLSDRVTLIEVVWTAVALFGLVVCTWSLIDSKLDQHALRETDTDGPALATVRINIRSAWAGMALHVFFLVLGVAALVTLNARQNLTGNLFGLGFIAVAAANAGTIARNQVARIRLRRYVRRHPLRRRSKDPQPEP